MRIVSMVPSWTETLIEAGADVVGRTRFCIHPREQIKAVPAIGGTKDWDLKKLDNLKPDLIILDREENTREMGAYAGAPILTTHVRNINDMPKELASLSSAANLPKLMEYSHRFSTLLNRPIRHKRLADLPGVVEWLRPLEDEEKIKTIVYMIWKNPWMAVSRQTFIGSVLEHVVGENKILFTDEQSYPQISLDSLNEETTLLLFSTEPFPFAKQKEDLRKLRFPSAIVDGEKWSWFGLRSLLFLESFHAL